MSSTPDVLVAGGGPAGLVAALACRARGLAVRVLEPAGPGRDKPCGEGLMPDAIEVLGRLGVDLAGAGRRFRGIRWCDAHSDALGRFPGRPGLGVRRTVLHERLWRAASEAGVELERARVDGLERDRAGWRARTGGGEVQARFVVGADGLRSSIRAWAGLAARGAPRRRRFGARRHFTVAAWSEEVEVHWAEGVEAYVTPVADDLVGVAILWSDPPVAGPPATTAKPVFGHLLSRFRELGERLAGAEPVSEAAGRGPLEQRVHRAVAGNLALVGDAAGYLDAITGEGMAIAFAEAEALAGALAEGRPERYERERRRLVRRPETITRLALALSRRPALRRRVLRRLARRPELFDRVLALHVGAARGGELRLAAALLARLLAG